MVKDNFGTMKRYLQKKDIKKCAKKINMCKNFAQRLEI